MRMGDSSMLLLHLQFTYGFTCIIPVLPALLGLNIWGMVRVLFFFLSSRGILLCT